MGARRAAPAASGSYEGSRGEARLTTDGVLPEFAGRRTAREEEGEVVRVGARVVRRGRLCGQGRESCDRFCLFFYGGARLEGDRPGLSRKRALKLLRESRLCVTFLVRPCRQLEKIGLPITKFTQILVSDKKVHANLLPPKLDESSWVSISGRRPSRRLASIHAASPFFDCFSTLL